MGNDHIWITATLKNNKLVITYGVVVEGSNVHPDEQPADVTDEQIRDEVVRMLGVAPDRRALIRIERE